METPPHEAQTIMVQHKTGSKGERRRAEILATAREVLIRKGYDFLVMRDIAARANMTLGNLQYYFPTRESLVEAIVRAEAQTDLEDLRAFRSDEGDEILQLKRFVKYIVRKWRGDSGKVLATMSFLTLHLAPFRRIYTEVYNAFYEELASLLARIDPGHKRATYLRRARLITALIDGSSMQVQRGSSPDFLNDVATLALQIAGGD